MRKLFTPILNKQIGLIVSILTLIALLTYFIFINNKLHKEYTPLIVAAQDIKLQTTLAHLSVEELIDGHGNKTFENVIETINKAHWYATAMLEGASNETTTIVALKDTQLRTEVTLLKTQIEAFKLLLTKRYEIKNELSEGYELDTTHLTKFDALMNQASLVIFQISKYIETNEKYDFLIELILVAFSFLLSVIIFYIIKKAEFRLKNKQLQLEDAMIVNLSLYKEQKLQNEEQATILNAFSDGVYLSNSDFDIQFLNGPMQAKIGYNAIGEKCYKAVKGKDKPCESCYFNDLKKEKQISYDLEEDGKHYIVLSTLLANNSKITVYHDITNIKEVEKELQHKIIEYKVVNEELKQQKFLFETMFNSISDSVLITNTSRDIILANKGMETTFCYSPDELIGNKTSVLYADEAKFIERGKKVFDKNSESLNDFYLAHYKNKKGDTFPGETFGAKLHDTEGNWIGNLSIIRNIQERIKAQEKLQQSAYMISSSSDIIALVDRNFTYCLVNESFGKAFATSTQQIIGKKISDFLGETAFEKTVKPHALKCLNDGVSVNYKDWFYFPVLGSYFMDINYYPFYNEQKEITGFIVNARNITEQKHNEDELISAKHHAEQSDQLKTEFLNNMSHEIRTPLNGILGFSEMLGLSGLSDTKRINYIKIIQNSGNQLLHIIDDILEISALGTKQVKVVEKALVLNTLLWNLFSIFDIKAKENKTPLYLKNELTDKQSTIITDSSKLNKVLSNLLENALKFTNEGSIELGYQLKNNEIEIYVKDTGIGIEEDKHETIFERFSQAEKDLSKKVGGLGLGLSIVKENTELLGGNIKLVSKKNEGSTFFISIPYKPVYIDDEIHETKSNQTILIAEDEEVNYLFLETVLKDILKLNYKLVHVKNGQEAIDFCKTNHNIVLVLMDLKMPVVNGFEATAAIKKVHPNLKIIAQTSYTNIRDKEKAAAVGCDGFISKPIEVSALTTLIHAHLKIKEAN